MKPHIAIDCFLGTLELEPEIKNISSMVKVALGDAECDHQYFPVACVALDETAAEKWIALSRRVVDANKTPRDSDKHLVQRNSLTSIVTLISLVFYFAIFIKRLRLKIRCTPF